MQSESSWDALLGVLGLGAILYLSPFYICKSLDQDFPLPAGFFRPIIRVPPGTMDWRQANPARAGRQQRQFDHLCRSSLADFFSRGPDFAVFGHFRVVAPFESWVSGCRRLFQGGPFNSDWIPRALPWAD